MQDHGVIVIGAGHNGLVAAATLAAAGRKVLVVEAQSFAGGLCAGDEFHEGFRSAGMLHDTSMLRPGVIDSLGLSRESFGPPPPVLVAQADGPGILLSSDTVAMRTELAQHSQRDAERYGEYHAFLSRVAPVLTGVLDDAPPQFDGGLEVLLSLARRGLAVRRLGRDDMAELLRVPPMCVADWLNEWFETELLSCGLALPALAGTWMGPWSPGSAGLLIRTEVLSGRAFSGGAGGLIAALEQAARSRGVDFRFDARVERIVTSSGGVEGVALEGGEKLHASVVCAACDPKQAMLDLLPVAELSPEAGHEFEMVRARGTTARVDMALKGPLRFACRPDLDVVRACVVDTLDGMERAFDPIKYGRFGDVPVLEVIVGDSAPEGHTSVSVVAHFVPHELEGGWNDEQCERLGDVVLDRLATVAPRVKDKLLARRVMSPVDIESRYGVSGGHVHHLEHALDQLIMRPAPSCARYKTPVKGLYLCGSGSHPGGGITGAPGLLGARAVQGG